MKPRWRIPLWIHVPWFFVALVLVIGWWHAEHRAWQLSWPWSPGASLPERVGCMMLATWGAFSHRCAELSPAQTRAIAAWWLRRRRRT